MGAIGAVIGHELTHGFDDQGSNYDKDGNLVNWWTDASITAFEQKAECMTNQYSEFYMPEIDAKVNGKLTLGENIADNGGLKMAYQALKLFESNNTDPRLSGMQEFSSDQLLYLSWANVWCTKYQKEQLQNLVLTDEHSPAEFRCKDTSAHFGPVGEMCRIMTIKTQNTIKMRRTLLNCWINGPMINSDNFAKAFKCQEGSKMNPGKSKLCNVW